MELDIDGSALSVRDTLMKIYAAQLASISYDESISVIGTHSFENLKELIVRYPNSESFGKVLASCKHLESLYLSGFDGKSYKFQYLVCSSLAKLRNLDTLFLCVREVFAGEIVAVVENALILLNNTKSMKRTSM